MSGNKFLSTENGLKHEKIAILDAGAQYGKVIVLTINYCLDIILQYWIRVYP